MVGDARPLSITDLHVFGPERFADLEEIGEGQNARVYRAWDTELNRLVAIKVAIEDMLVEDLGAKGEDAARIADYIEQLEQEDEVKATYTLWREAQLLAKVDAPGVLSVYELGYFEEDGALGMVMPHLSGTGPSNTDTWPKVLDCVLQLGEGLAAVHEAGVLHRDLKPNNILYDGADRPYITDFGLACELADEEAMSHRAGTHEWMAPEQLVGMQSSVQTDLYSFCMIAFAMFYGHPPFANDEAKAQGRISDIERGDDTPAAIREALVKGLETLPSQRWSTMDELLEALREPLRPKQPQQPPPRRRAPWIAAAGMSAVAAVAVGMCVSMPEAKADACDDVSKELVDFWNDDVQAELRVVLGTRRANDRLESFASRWVTVRAQECEAAKRDERPDRASPCTASVRGHLNATIDTLRTPHQREGVDFERVLAELPEPEYCLEHPEDGEYGIGGLFELRRMDIELSAILASHELELGERRQADYMLAARELSAKYDIGRAIYWRAELHRLRGELDEAEDDFRRAFSEAQSLDADEFAGDAMLKLAEVAGAKGDLGALDERAFVARTVFSQRRPDKIAELLQVQGLALVEGDPEQRDRGLALLRDAVDMREAQHSHYGGSREKVGAALESLARGLLAAEKAEEAVQLAKQSLAIHELEYGGLTQRAHDLRRLLFTTQVIAGRIEHAEATIKVLLHRTLDDEDWPGFVEQSMWISQVYADAGFRPHAKQTLLSARQAAVAHGHDDLTRAVDQRLLELRLVPENPTGTQSR